MPSLRPALFLLILAAPSIGAQESAATGGSVRVVDQPVELLVTAETEQLVCQRQHSVEQQAIQRRGPGWYTRGWDGLFPISWIVDLTATGRQVTLGVESNRRPRELIALGPRPRAAGGGTESVRIRFLADGSVQDGRRATSGGRESMVRSVVQSGLLPEDGVLGYTLARELAYRCERGLTEPLVPGWIWSQIPPA